jgi:hypothetical protein
MRAYLFKVGVALSILFNVILGGRSYQPFSARNYQRKKDNKLNLVWFIDLVLQKGHCRMSWVHFVLLTKERG